ncbi:MAG: calcium-binding protein [Okeania sp. SIO2C2]|uniref:EF-hand domain-containing protein n=1 Tax=Okeania sp. SIO2C2 TaxID=2607787 RepID=UPI0013B7C97F|nr:EF-hand domain-containing protein [Okeania sp. SIO2C2]NEP87274.1 calcium-binding protein [Okeania sp. SIO2C2]
MISNISEIKIHRVRMAVALGWCVLIFSLFYDPISTQLTEASNVLSPFKINPENCVLLQGKCIEEIPYAMGAPLFWGLIVPCGVLILFVFGHEFWRRICPLSFISQIPRALGWERKRKRVSGTGKVRKELVKVAKNSWLAQNHLCLQFGLLYVGVCARIVFVNSNRLALGLFLTFTIISALTVGFLYGGKSWCQYICPMAPVQKIYGQPRGLFNSTAHKGDRKPVTQSMCRTVTQEGKELSACVACTTKCIDIDAESAYWDEIESYKQQWLYYGYIGLTVGYFVYYYLYAGNWDYLISGVWSHEESQLADILKPGYYLLGEPIDFPKLLAVPVTIGLFIFGAIGIGCALEDLYKAYHKRHHKHTDSRVIRHQMFTLCTFFIFNFFFIFSARGYVKMLPSPLPSLFPVFIMVSSSLWLYRTWRRTPSRYQRESLATRLQKQLKKLNLDTAKFLDGRSIDDLNADEVYVLAKVLPDFSQEKRLQTYKAMLRDAIDEGYVYPANTLENFKQMRQELGISDKDHDTILVELGQEYPELFDPRKPHNRENSLRLESYRETLLEIILHSGKTHPDRNWVANLMKAFSEETSNEVLEDLLKNLSPEDRNLVQELRQEYSITKDDEADALKHTDSYQLWKTIAESLGFVEHIISVEEEQLYRVFQYIDTDRSGYISLDELQTYIRSIDTHINDVQIENMMKTADTSGDDLISYEEFQAVFKSLKSQTI